MKAFLLAAGKGTRLRPFTDTHPKCLIPIDDRPLLAIWLDLLARSGVDQVLINTHHHADQVERFIAEYRSKTAIEILTVYEPDLLGSAGTVWQNRRFVDGQEDFVIAYADNLTDLNLAKMVDRHIKFRSMGGILTMGLIQAPDPRQCGIVTLDDQSRIVNFVEKPEQPESDLANGGIYIANCRIFDYFPLASIGNETVFDLGHDLLPRLSGVMYGYTIEDYLRDIGNPAAYQQALTEWGKRIAVRQ
jgi:mannose-1-phosphate guanylyltransferase